MTKQEWKALAETKREEIKEAAELALRTSFENRHICSVIMYSDGDIHVYEEISSETHPGENILLVQYDNPFGDIEDLYEPNGTLDMSRDVQYIIDDIF